VIHIVSANGIKVPKMVEREKNEAKRKVKTAGFSRTTSFKSHLEFPTKIFNTIFAIYIFLMPNITTKLRYLLA